MFEAIKDVFPTRPLRIHYSGTSKWMAVIGSAFGAALLLFLNIYFFASGIINDYKVSQSDQVISVTKRSHSFACFRTVGIIIYCTGDYKDESNRYIRHPPATALWLDFFNDDIHTDNGVMIVGQEQTLTAHYAVENIWDRIFFFIAITVFALLWFGYVWKLIRQILKGRKMMRQRHVLLPVKITLANSTQWFNFISYSVTLHHPETNKYIRANLTMRPGESVIMLDVVQKQALGVIPNNGEVPVLLDDKLLRVDFTDAERARIFAAIGGEAPSRL